METVSESRNLVSKNKTGSYQTIAEFQPALTTDFGKESHPIFGPGLIVPSLGGKGKNVKGVNEKQISGEPSPTLKRSGSNRRRRSLTNSRRHSLVSSGSRRNSASFAGDSSIDRWPLTLVTLVTVFVSSASRVYSLVIDQYLYSVYAKDIFGDTIIDTSSEPCLNTSDSNPNASSDKALVTEVQDRTSNMHLYLDVISYSLGMLSNMALGTVAALISRKLLLVIPTLGFFLKCAMLSIVVYWELDLQWLYLSYAVDGLCGNVIGILMGSFLYTADITSRDKKRTLGVAIVEAAKGIISGGVYVAAGQLIERSGYIVPSLVACGLQLIAIVLVLILPNRKPKDLENKKKNWTLKGALEEILSPFLVPESNRLRKLSTLAAISFLVLILARSGVDKIRNLYLMNMPFCFGAITIGWFLFAREIGQYAATVIAVALAYRWLPGFGLAILGVVSNMAAFLMYAFAQTDWHIYLAPVLGLAENLSFTMIRGEGSRLLGPEYQGPWFASLSVVDSISLALSPPVFIPIYTATLETFTGSVFVGCAALLVVVVVLMVIYQVIWIRHMRDVMYNTLEIVKEEDEHENKDDFKEKTKLTHHLVKSSL
ncbi:proton-coupled folate transporter [Biomphalaria pfeifferi]|uniref:Proton-coupled folate transporter n=1 Tax=Biomphalaria pfeifferi TaxID=112525 RepID=A0AAD8F027_BIOPF|nr:proton-coupled folate transporter [Biomphalaria pfeifferi]